MISKKSDLNKVREIINKSGRKYFFVCNDLIHALSISGVIEKPVIISYDESPLADALRSSGAEIFLMNETNNDFGELKTTNNLISHDFTRDVISNYHGEKNLLVFKSSHIVEEYADKLNLNLLAPSAKIARGIENKVTFYNELMNEDLNLIPGEIIKVSENTEYSKLADKYGAEFVMQASKGFGGNKTFHIRNKSDLTAIKDIYNKRSMRLTKYIPGRTLTINGCVTSIGTMVRPPFFQLTGIAELTSNVMGACGNDFDISSLDTKLVCDVMKSTKRIGDIISKKGFSGIFGVDYIVNGDTAYFVECNPRFVTSLTVFTQLETKNEDIPLVAYHILEHLGMIDTLKNIPKDNPNFNNFSGNQLIMHNLSGVEKSVSSDMDCGVYTFRNGEILFLRSGCLIDDLRSEDEFLLIPKPKGTVINGGIECARIFTYDKALSDGELNLTTKEIVEKVYCRLFE